jgi:hypothetical protein
MMRHATMLLFLVCFPDRVLCFCLHQALDPDPLTFACQVAGITILKHYAQLLVYFFKDPNL